MGFTGVTKKITLLIEFFHLLYTETRFSDPLWNSPLLRQSPNIHRLFLSWSKFLKFIIPPAERGGSVRNNKFLESSIFFQFTELTLDVQIHPQKVFENVWNIFWGVQKPSQEVFGCLGLLPSLPVIPHVRISVSLDFLSHLLKPSGLFGVPNSLTPPHQVWLYNLYMNDD